MSAHCEYISAKEYLLFVSLSGIHIKFAAFQVLWSGRPQRPQPSRNKDGYTLFFSPIDMNDTANLDLGRIKQDGKVLGVWLVPRYPAPLFTSKRKMCRQEVLEQQQDHLGHLTVLAVVGYQEALCTVVTLALLPHDRLYRASQRSSWSLRVVEQIALGRGFGCWDTTCYLSAFGYWATDCSIFSLSAYCPANSLSIE